MSNSNDFHPANQNFRLFIGIGWFLIGIFYLSANLSSDWRYYSGSLGILCSLLYLRQYWLYQSKGFVSIFNDSIQINFVTRLLKPVEVIHFDDLRKIDLQGTKFTFVLKSGTKRKIYSSQVLLKERSEFNTSMSKIAERINVA